MVNMVFQLGSIVYHRLYVAAEEILAEVEKNPTSPLNKSEENGPILRSFVHHRLYAAAEEILREVEKTITLALSEAKVSGSKEEMESLLNQKPGAEPPLTNSSEASEQCDATRLQESPGPSRPSEMEEESNLSLRLEVPGPSETSGDMDSSDWNYCTTGFAMSQIKEEQDVEDLPETELTYEIKPESPDWFPAQCNSNDSDEKSRNRERTQMKTQSETAFEQSDNIEKKKLTAPAEDSYANNQKERSKRAEPPLTNSSEASEQCDAIRPQESPGPSRSSEMEEESKFSLRPEVPGPSKTSGDMDSSDWNYCTTGFTMSQIKEEQDVEDLPETELTYELKPESPDWFPAQCNSNDSDEKRRNRKRAQMKTQSESALGHSGIIEWKQQMASAKDSSAKSQKECSFCHLCGKTSQYIGSLKEHMKTHEGKVDCSVCAVTFQSTKELINHLRYGHNKTHFCDICGKVFAKARGLRLHKKIHAGIKKFECQECGKLFARKQHLIVHVRTHSGERPFICDVCGKAFSQNPALIIHKRSHSGEKPYHCGVCCKRFYSGSHLKTHMRYHSGEKPYPCDICGKRFIQREKMTKHRMTHRREAARLPCLRRAVQVCSESKDALADA